MLKRLILAAASVALFAAGAHAQDTKPVRIGYAISKTGLFAPGAAAQIKSYELWREQVNAKGGLDVAGVKRPVVFDDYDDQSSAANDVKIYEKLITDDKVDLLFAPYATAAHLAIVPLLERYHFPMVANTASSVLIREIKPGNIWFVSPSVHDKLAAELVKMAQENHVKSVALLSNLLPPANEIRRYLLADLKSAGITITMDQVYPPDVKDMTGLLTQVKQAHPDAVFDLSLFNDAILYTRQAKELGIAAPLQFVAIGPSSPAYRKIFGAAVNGIVTIGHWTQVRKEWPLARPFYDAFRKKYGEDPDYLDSVLSYMSCEITEQAVAKAGLDLNKLRQAISTSTFDTINGPVRFNGVENAITPVAFMQIQDGKIQIVWPHSIATAPFKPKTGW
jgi:branched-chain amino acid transport system substrate-binding protein